MQKIYLTIIFIEILKKIKHFCLHLYLKVRLKFFVILRKGGRYQSVKIVVVKLNGDC